MSTQFITKQVWKEITAAARRSKQRAWVAVAYFGKDGPNLLPLPAGSHLVVDASESAVKCGRTCPEALKKLVNRGVLVYTVNNLHAKTFVFGSTAFAGSANASSLSANGLVEAVLKTNDRQAVADAKAFVQSLCLDELGPEALDRLQGIYRPPKFAGGRQRQVSRRKNLTGAELSRLHLAQLTPKVVPEEAEEDQEQGRAVAKRQMERPRRHVLDEFHWTGQCAIRRGDSVIQVDNDPGNGSPMISPPGIVVHTREWSNGKRRMTFVYVERPSRRRARATVLAKRLGNGGQQALKRGGLVRSKEWAEKLRQVWQN